MVKVILKAMEILKCFTAKKTEWTANEIAVRLDMNRTTVYRILNTLSTGGFVQFSPASGKYSLGTTMLGLGIAFYNNMDIRSAAGEVLKNLAAKTKESVQLTIWHNDRVTVLDQWESPHEIKVSVPIGASLPAFCTATGKIFLASLPEDEIDRYLAEHNLKKFTDKTNIKSEVLKEELKKIKKELIAFDFEEYVTGMIGCAVPVFSYDRKTIASIAVLGPNNRMGTIIDKIALMTMEAGSRISGTMGYTGP